MLGVARPGAPNPRPRSAVRNATTMSTAAESPPPPHGRRHRRAAPPRDLLASHYDDLGAAARMLNGPHPDPTDQDRCRIRIGLPAWVPFRGTRQRAARPAGPAHECWPDSTGQHGVQDRLQVEAIAVQTRRLTGVLAAAKVTQLLSKIVNVPPVLVSLARHDACGCHLPVGRVAGERARADSQRPGRLRRSASVAHRSSPGR